jgi:hypothetical protein
MQNYADDLDFAPMELMIVVRAIMSLTLGLPSVYWPPSHVPLTSDMLWRCAHLIRTAVARSGFALARTLATSPMFITRGGLFLCAHDAPLLTCVSRLAAFLQDYGFDGVIPSPDVQRRDNIQGSGKRGDPPPRAEDGAFPWPRYTRTPKPEIVYPAVLEATTPEQFRLSLPCPTTRHACSLLHLYSRRNSHLRLMTSLTYIWMRSWDIKEINPQTLCLLLIRFFQVKRTLAFPHSDFL